MSEEPEDPQPVPERPPTTEEATQTARQTATGTRDLSQSDVDGERFEIRGEIARGGMGAILKVWDEDLHRHLAMKVVLAAPGVPIASAGTQVSQKMLGRFLEEAQVTGQLDHPGIVPVHEMGVSDERGAFFTMPLVEGRDFKVILDLVHSEDDGEEWTQTRALNVMLKVCDAMAYAHEKGVIHRDLKPSNIMIGRFGEVYVMDWGLSRVLGKEDRHDLRIRSSETGGDFVETERSAEASGSMDSMLFTMDGDVVGTPAYMSPEQALGKVQQLDRRSDVYSAGAMLYHIVTGCMPYVAKGERLGQPQILLQLVNGPPAPVIELAPNAPQELVAIIDKAMAREPDERYVDMQALAKDLRAYLERRVVEAYETGAWAEIRKWVARNKGIALASAAAILAVLVGGVVSWLSYLRAEENATLAETRRQQAVASAEEATRNEILAREREEAAEAERVKVLRLSDTRRLEEFESEADALWPAYPAKIPEYDAWIGRAEQLVGRLATHRAALAKLEAQAVDSGAGSPRFATTEELWQFDVLSELVADIERFAADEGLLADVRARREFAETIEERTVSGEDAVFLWGGAMDSIASESQCPQYGGLEIEPQLGLLPLGQDRESGLWEFAHVQSGDIPTRDEAWNLVLPEDPCIVLVLIPGGTFMMGSQPDDPSGANYDPDALPSSHPVNEVTLDPYFISKYELTQGQWVRFMSDNPSGYSDSSPFVIPWRRHPVEQVSWTDCDTYLARLGLMLPTEAQWEFAARAGTSTIWWTGNDRESLRGFANLADGTARRRGATWPTIDDWPDLFDGFAAHAPISSYPPNPFGLHEVHGNVWEWARDWYLVGGYQKSAREGDGLRDIINQRVHAYRGGSFIDTAARARSAFRTANAPDYVGSSIGVRPARALER